MEKKPHIAVVPSAGFTHLVPVLEFSKRLVHLHPDFHITCIIPSVGSIPTSSKSYLQTLPPTNITSIFLPPITLDQVPDASNLAVQIELSVTHSLPSIKQELNSLCSRSRVVALVVDVFAQQALDLTKNIETREIKMTEECGGNTVATSTTTPLNWWYLQANTLSSSWNDTTTKHAWNNVQMNSSSSCEEDISVSTSNFTNASNHSSLTVESSRRLVDPPPPSSNELMGSEHASDNHLWSHVLSGVGSNGELHNSQEIGGENCMDALSSKGMTNAMFEPACDYLKKLDTTNWEYSGNSTPFNSFEKHLNGYSEALIENNERLTKLSNLVSTWSIAPPDPEVSSSHFDNIPQTNNNMSLDSSMDKYHYPHSDSDPSCHFKQQQQQPFIGDSVVGGAGNKNSAGVVVFPSYDHHHQHHDHDMKGIKQEYHVPASGAVFGKPFNSNGYNQDGLINGLSVGDSEKIYHGLPNLSPCTKSLSDFISFNSRLGIRPVIGIHAQRPSMKDHLNLSQSKKQQGLQSQTPSPMRTTNGRGEGTTREVKKKRSEESSEAILKKPKQDTSTASSKAPKVKLGDKITALQQIVSPFGKTDTASVLFEAIGYIQFLQEQVQLLSNPYLKTNSHKDPRGMSFDRKDKEEGKLDLRSRGLCLVPTSCTPLVYRENSGPDYWTPAYRGCLYR